MLHSDQVVETSDTTRRCCDETHVALHSRSGGIASPANELHDSACAASESALATASMSRLSNEGHAHVYLHQHGGVSLNHVTAPISSLREGYMLVMAACYRWAILWHILESKNGCGSCWHR